MNLTEAEKEELDKLKKRMPKGYDAYKYYDLLKKDYRVRSVKIEHGIITIKTRCWVNFFKRINSKMSIGSFRIRIDITYGWHRISGGVEHGNHYRFGYCLGDDEYILKRYVKTGDFYRAAMWLLSYLVEA